MDKKVRMADIAQRLGISVVSVSKALSGKDGVSEEMRAQIKRLAAEMGYVPLRTKPQERKDTISNNIGILVADRFFADNTFYSNLYRQVLMCCNEQGFSALLEIITPDAERSCLPPAMVQGGKVDGLIFMGEFSRDYVHALAATSLPYMLLDFYDESLDADSVTSDNITGSYRMTRHLLENGYRDIAFLGSIHATSSIMDRFLGYSKALLRAGIPVRMDWVLEDRDEKGFQTTVQLPEHMPKAFVCNCDEVAYHLIQQLQRKGYRVPEDIAVTGYDDYRYALISNPQLTTYRVSIEDMGSTVVGQLIRKIKGKRTNRGNMVLNGRFIRRGSA